MHSTKFFEYKILSKNYLADKTNLQDFREVYQFWTNVWTEMLTKAGCPEALVVDDFYRADIMPVVKYRGQIVGSICSTIFDLRNPCLKDLRYFSIFPNEAKQWISAQRPRYIMTVEWLCVDKRFRSSNLGFSMGEIMIQLSFQMMRDLNIDMVMGVTVKAAGVDKLATNLGGTVIGDNVKRGNLDCCIVAQPMNNVLYNHPDPKMDEMIKSLWERREYSFELDNSLIKKVG